MSELRPLLVYDDRVTVPPEVAALTGVAHFGDVLRRRERLSATVRGLVEAAGLEGPLHVRDADEGAAAEERMRRRPAEGLVLIVPSHLAPTAERDDAVLFLRKLRYMTQPVALGAHGACLADPGAAADYLAEAQAGEAARWLRDYAGGLPPVEDALDLADLTRLPVAIEFLSASFSARHFNHIAQDRHHVVKRSADRDKIRREYRFFGLLPEAMQPYFVQPYDYTEDADGAGYRMRRLFVPDLAVQWAHRAFSAPEFETLLGHLMHFVASRPRRDVGRERAEAVAQDLYVDKVERRIDDLLALPAGQQVDALLHAGGLDGGVRGLYARYRGVLDRAGRRRRGTELAITHGDLGFSNILYSPATQTLALIDPRGAETEDELFSDPHYDVAKLAHSVLGDYDAIVAGLFELVHRDDLGLDLRIDHPPARELQLMFVAALEAGGFDPALVRTYEASLFLSMLPLHIDVPKRVAAFALRARDILDELER